MRSIVVVGPSIQNPYYLPSNSKAQLAEYTNRKQKRPRLHPIRTIGTAADPDSWPTTHNSLPTGFIQNYSDNFNPGRKISRVLRY